MTDDAVQLDLDDSIATITITSPDLRNALTSEVVAGLDDALDRIEEGDPRCVVIEGSEGIFSGGGDISAMMDGLTGERAPHEKAQFVTETGQTLKRIHELSLPVVAKIDGTAFGAGAGLALACDTQIASDRSKISFGFRQVGLAVDSGVSYFLPRIVGENKAMDLLYTGELLSAGEAHRLGIFTQVYAAEAFESRAQEYIDRIATGPTVALGTSKRLIRQGLGSDLDQAITNEAAAQTAVFETDDHQEGATAFVEQREAEFRGE